MDVKSRVRWGSLSWLLIALTCGAWSCGGPPARADLRSGNALDRARGVVAVTESRDDLAVHKLVDLLDDPDRGVRMYAIMALERLCGETYGYRYYESAPRRAPAIERWREALRQGNVVLKSSWNDGAQHPSPDLVSRDADASANDATMGGPTP
jgi:hypothetical protein